MGRLGITSYSKRPIIFGRLKKAWHGRASGCGQPQAAKIGKAAETELGWTELNSSSSGE